MTVYKKHKVFGKEQIITTHTPNKLKQEQRVGLYTSDKAIKERDWNKLLSLPSTNDRNLLSSLQSKFLIDGGSNCPNPFPIDLRARWESNYLKRTPKIFCEFGMGFTTYEFLKWCEVYNGYLITVEMPIALEQYSEQKNFAELYYHGVDRYWAKYKHCTELLKTDVAKKHWLWINDDIFTVTDKIVNDKAYRNKLFLNGKIDYFYEDAIHCDEFLKDLLKKMTPFMNKNGIFTGDDNTPTMEF